MDLTDATRDTVQATEKTHLSGENGDRERGPLNVIAHCPRTGVSPW